MKQQTIVLSPNTSDYTVKFPQGFKNVKSVKLINIEIPNVWFAVNSTNDNIHFGSNNATLNHGSYSASDLCTEIETAMETESAQTFSCTYDSNRLEFTITCLIGTIALNSDSTAAKLIGLTTTTSGDSLWNSNNAINISGTNHVYILSDSLTKGKDQFLFCDKDSNVLYKSILVRIPIDESFGSVIRFHDENDIGVINYGKSTIITDIDLQLVDEDFNSIDLRGINYHIEMIITSEQD